MTGKIDVKNFPPRNSITPLLLCSVLDREFRKRGPDAVAMSG
jgi:hypothetical protein